MTRETGHWMPMYWADYFGDTTHLTTEQHGAYLLLIGTYWRRGGALPNDDKWLAAVTKMHTNRWRQIKKCLEGFFVTDQGGVWTHKRLELEILKSSNRLHSARASGRAGGLAKSKLSTYTYTKKERVPNGTSKKPEDDPWFENFWAQFPKKRAGSRHKAWRASIQARQRGSPDEILNGVHRYAASDEVARGFAKGAAAWLNDDRWTFDYTPPMEGAYDRSNGSRKNGNLTRSQTAVAGILGDDFGMEAAPGHPERYAAAGNGGSEPGGFAIRAGSVETEHGTSAADLHQKVVGHAGRDEGDP